MPLSKLVTLFSPSTLRSADFSRFSAGAAAQGPALAFAALLALTVSGPTGMVAGLILADGWGLWAGLVLGTALPFAVVGWRAWRRRRLETLWTRGRPADGSFPG